MKACLIILFLGFITISADAQIGVEVKMGSTSHKFKGNPIFNNNESESTYYLVDDGILHYYYVNKYNGKCIQFIHTECEIKALDLKSVEYKDYDGSGKFMYISTKKNQKAITHTKIDDSELRGPSEDANLTNEEEATSTFLLILNDLEMAEALLSSVKKG